MRFHSASLPIIVISGLTVDTCVVLGCEHLRAGMSVLLALSVGVLYLQVLQ